MILQNQVRCKKCGDEPYSAHRHDYKYCKCGAVAVDGGMEYLRRVGDVENMEEMSYTMNNNIVNDCVAAIKWGKDTKRNDLGIALAVLRALKKHNKLVLDHE
jgi:hypothetical protein